MHRVLNSCLVLAAATSAIAAVTSAMASPATTFFANSVSASSGTVSNAAGAVGSFATSEGGYAVDPFFPPYSQTASGSYPAVLATVGGSSTTSASSLTLKFAQPFAVGSSSYLGVYSSVGLINTQTIPGDQPQTPSSGAIELSTPSEAIVSVSADGTHFVALNGGNPIAFDIPTNAYTSVDDTVVSSGGYTFVSPQPAAPGRPPVFASSTPFLGTLDSFYGKTESQLLSQLNGTAGGTWINVNGAGLSSIQYVEFTVPAGDTAFINAAALSDPTPTVVPEPGALALLCLAPAGWWLCRRKQCN